MSESYDWRTRVQKSEDGDWVDFRVAGEVFGRLNLGLGFGDLSMGSGWDSDYIQLDVQGWQASVLL